MRKLNSYLQRKLKQKTFTKVIKVRFRDEVVELKWVRKSEHFKREKCRECHIAVLNVIMLSFVMLCVPLFRRSWLRIALPFFKLPRQGSLFLCCPQMLVVITLIGYYLSERYFNKKLKRKT